MDKKSPKGRKRSAKNSGGAGVGPSTSSEDNYWDCSVCTFRNHAEAFKCSMCDVRKGTSTRKPRINPDLVAAQHAQALTPPPTASTPTPSSSSATPNNSIREELDPDEDAEDDEVTIPVPSASKAKKGAKEKKTKTPKEPKEPKKNSSANRAKLKNVDRSTATYHSVTVNDVTVVITEFKAKPKKEKKTKNSNPKKSSTSTASAPSDSGAASGADKIDLNSSVPDTSNQENIANRNLKRTMQVMPMPTKMNKS